MLSNLIIILAILGTLIFIFCRKYKDLKEADATDYFTDEENLSLEYMENEVKRTFSDMLRENLNDQNLTRDMLINKQNRIGKLRTAVTESGYGDEAAKRIMINNIIFILKKKKYGINSDTVNQLFPFNDKEKLSSVDCFEIVFYYYHKKKKLPMNRIMDRIFEDGQFIQEGALQSDIMEGDEEFYVDNKDITCTESKDYCVTEEMMYALYEKLEDKIRKFTIDDKIEIVAQRLFQNLYGYSVADLLYYSGIDEIDVGVSGLHDEHQVMSINERIRPASWKSVWIMYHGIDVHLEFLYFRSQADMVRVVDMIYGYDAAYVMSKEEGRVVGQTKKGSRVSAGRPPFADSYFFCLRNFDDSSVTYPYGWTKGDKNAFVPVHLFKWTIKGFETVALCGGMGTGKTTLLKAVSLFIPPNVNLFVQELKRELNLRKLHTGRNILSFQETAKLKSQEAIDFSKKTNRLYCIIGEAAEAAQITYIVQNKGVAYKGIMFTHHANKHEDLIEIGALNLLQEKIYSNKHDAIEACAKTFTVCFHLSKNDRTGHRYIDRISECCLLEDKPYPSQESKHMDSSSQEKYYIDTVEFEHRVTNPKQYECRTIAEYDEKEEMYRLVNLPSEDMVGRIALNLTEREEKLFRYDLELMEQITAKNTVKNI